MSPVLNYFHQYKLHLLKLQSQVFKHGFAQKQFDYFAQVEVSSKAAFIASIPNVRGYIDIHAYSQYWMHPYAYSYSFCPDDGLLVSMVRMRWVVQAETSSGPDLTPTVELKY